MWLVVGCFWLFWLFWRCIGVGLVLVWCWFGVGLVLVWWVLVVVGCCVAREKGDSILGVFLVKGDGCNSIRFKHPRLPSLFLMNVISQISEQKEKVLNDYLDVFVATPSHGPQQPKSLKKRNRTVCDNTNKNNSSSFLGLFVDFFSLPLLLCGFLLLSSFLWTVNLTIPIHSTTHTQNHLSFQSKRLIKLHLFT